MVNGIQKAIADSTIRQRAAQFGETIRAEDGMGEAAKIIRDLHLT
ncbi:hypothetical protein [Floridanema aerugineum]|uniref:Uncharacterized protein n=1 Tax=Floridaenema aerugineum BLCC-F46 TaxID=3153654 RepID=A0ABV4X582_9CYAN